MLGAQGWPPAQLPQGSCSQVLQSLELTSHGDTAIYLMPSKDPLPTQGQNQLGQS